MAARDKECRARGDGFDRAVVDLVARVTAMHRSIVDAERDDVSAHARARYPVARGRRAHERGLWHCGDYFNLHDLLARQSAHLGVLRQRALEQARRDQEAVVGGVLGGGEVPHERRKARPVRARRDRHDTGRRARDRGRARAGDEPDAKLGVIIHHRGFFLEESCSTILTSTPEDHRSLTLVRARRRCHFGRTRRRGTERIRRQ